MSLASLALFVALGGPGVPESLAALADRPVERALDAEGLEPRRGALLLAARPATGDAHDSALVQATPAEPAVSVAQPEPMSRKRLASGLTGTLVGAGLFVTASAATWGVAHRAGHLGNEGNGGRDFELSSIALLWGGVGTATGGITMAIAAAEFGKAYPRDRPALGNAMIGAGTVVSVVGAGALFTTAVLVPSIDQACPIGMGCSLAGLQASTLVTSAGLGMVSFGAQLRPRPERRMDKDLRQSWVTGAVLASTGYLGGVTGGMLVWQADRDSAARRRARDRLFVPVAGPWLAAASPDVPLLFASFAALSGALQIAGAITLGISGAITAKKRGRRRRDAVVRDVVVAPTGTGMVLSGRF